MALRLERFIAISAILHILFGSIAMVSIQKPKVEPLGVYTVTLVSEEARVLEEASPPESSFPSESTPTTNEKAPPTKDAISTKKDETSKDEMSKKEDEIEADYKGKKIEELRERLHKQEALKNLQKRANEVSIKKSPIGKETSTYAQRLGSAIRQFWYYPSGRKGLEALISITILRDGTIKINRVERSSGNAVFDESALRAIKKLRSFEPPESETEIILRFSDEELG